MQKGIKRSEESAFSVEEIRINQNAEVAHLGISFGYI